MSKPTLLSVNVLLYELNRLKSPSAQAKYKRFIPLLRDAVTAIDYYEEENKGLRAEVKRLKGEL